MNKDFLLRQFQSVWRLTEVLCEPLVTEDYVIQSMPDVSPPKWHLGHTSWFFERVILQEFEKDYKPFHERYSFVFNSYYNSFGDRVRRDVRGTLSRPTVEQVFAYRRAVDERLQVLLSRVDEEKYLQIAPLLEIGIHHEQQHQELLVTDVKHIFASNPLLPVYRSRENDSAGQSPTRSASDWAPIKGGVFEIGAPTEAFAWDNERPRHRVLLEDFSLMTRPVTCGEYLQFIEGGGYRNPRWWLSDGWDAACGDNWQSPLYWQMLNGSWHAFTLAGMQVVNLAEPVTHLSFYEAAAYASWAGYRLPTEVEWEVAANTDRSGVVIRDGNFLDDGILQPREMRIDGEGSDRQFYQLFGDVWEWTNSAYLPYPGYQAAAGPLGEYNGKFMSNQMVLRGGSCATPREHIRASYRNFFQPEKRWQFTGLRLASSG